MELRQLECFVAVAEELHFGRAAARLCMTQPPLSRQIQLLEQGLGVSLLERSSRVVTLTAAGRRFLRDARHLLAYSARAASSARRASGGEAGHITLGFTAVAAYRLMPDWVMKARKLLPDVDIELRERVSTDLGRLLVARGTGCHAGAPPAAAGRFGASPDRTRTYGARGPAQIALLAYGTAAAALHRQPFVAYAPSEGKYFYERIAAALGAAGVEPDYVSMPARRTPCWAWSARARASAWCRIRARTAAGGRGTFRLRWRAPGCTPRSTWPGASAATTTPRWTPSSRAGRGTPPPAPGI